jgi:hypothetical protein
VFLPGDQGDDEPDQESGSCAVAAVDMADIPAPVLGEIAAGEEPNS